MSWTLILQGFLPLLVFVIVDTFAGLRAGIIAALVFAIADGAWEYHTTGEIGSITWVSVGLIVVLGAIAIRVNDSRFFKFQPVLVGVILACVLAYYQWFDTPFLVKMAPMIGRLAPPEVAAQINNPIMTERLAKISGQLIGLYLIHATLIAVTALRAGNVAWIVMRGVGFWVLFGLLMLFDSYLFTRN
jgi:hypothetical protein